MNKKGNIFNLPIVLLGLVMVVAILIGLLPVMSELLNQAQGSNSLNCPGYIDVYNDGGNYTYNATHPTSALACMGVKLYLPYVVLGVLIASVGVLFGMKSMGGSAAPEQQAYYG